MVLITLYPWQDIAIHNCKMVHLYVQERFRFPNALFSIQIFRILDDFDKITSHETRLPRFEIGHGNSITRLALLHVEHLTKPAKLVELIVIGSFNLTPNA
jgi:hypothetical protein